MVGDDGSGRGHTQRALTRSSPWPHDPTLLGGRAGDLAGRKRVFLAGVVLFTMLRRGDVLAVAGGEAQPW